MHRFFLTSEDQLSKNNLTIKTPDTVHQLVKVFRTKENDQYIFIDTETQSNLKIQITSVSKKEIQATVLDNQKSTYQPKHYLNLYFSPLKNINRVEFLLQKCTEIGVQSFTPLITQRTERHKLNYERLQKIIQEASEQSGRVDIPLLHPEQTFAQTLKSNNIKIIASPTTTTKFSQLNIPSPSDLDLFIGPEGGFSNEEIQEATSHSFQFINLGQLILRAETACIVASSQILL